MKKSQETVDFGHQEVNPEEKTRRVGGVFDAVASKYDVMNDLMSGGLHRVWKREFVKQIRLHDGMRILDLASGTGDIAFKLLKKAEAEGKKIEVVVSDINESMLDGAIARAVDSCVLQGLEWKVVNAEEIPFEDESFDAITMAYGIRNVTFKDKALSEMFRTLKPSGQMSILEFSPVDLPIVKQIYNLYSTHVIPRIGKIVTGDREAYQYFVESIQKFPQPAEFTQMIEQAGFEQVRHRGLTFGVTSIHTGYKV